MNIGQTVDQLEEIAKVLRDRPEGGHREFEGKWADSWQRFESRGDLLREIGFRQIRHRPQLVRLEGVVIEEVIEAARFVLDDRYPAEGDTGQCKLIARTILECRQEGPEHV